MLKTIKTKYRRGILKVPENFNIPDNSTVFISYTESDETDSGILQSSESYLDKIWNNNEDDIYEQLLNK